MHTQRCEQRRNRSKMPRRQTREVPEGLFVELIRSASELPFDDYRPYALELLRSVCEFDSAMWGTGTFSANAAPTYHSMTLHGIPQEVVVEHGKVAGNCAVSAEVVKRWRARVATFNLQEQATDRRFADCLRYADRLAFRNVLYATAPHALPGTVNFIALWRGLDSGRFARRDVRRIGELLQCAVRMGVINSERSIMNSTQGAAGGQSAQAIATMEGVLHYQDAQFATLLYEQWPDYSPPFLPSALQQRFAAGHARFIGNRVVVSSVRQGNKWILLARENKCMMQLTTAQLGIVELVAKGCLNKEAAARLGITEKTVRNQLTAVYKNLGVVGENRSGAMSGEERENWKRAALILWWAKQIGHQ
jgi:Bacterial regulatory proteins, luxR family